MRGHEPLVAMRRSGSVPRCAFIDVDDDACPLRMWKGWERERPHMAQILVERKDTIERLDLRCVVGMSVIVSGKDEARVRKVFDACLEAKADRVFASVTWGEWIGDVYRSTGCKTLDSEGSREWQQ